MARSNEARSGASQSVFFKPEHRALASVVSPQIMPDLPLPTERIKADEFYIKVAEHELNHALTAYVLGAKVISISFFPRNSDVLGATLVASRSAKEHQVIAAAGAVSTPSGHAEGYGSDLYQVNMHAIFNNGMSEITAIKTAQSALNIYDEKIIRRAAEIMIALGRTLNGSELGNILARAEWEIREMPKKIDDRKAEEKLRSKYAFLNERLEPEDKLEGILATLDNPNPKGLEFISDYKPLSEEHGIKIKAEMQGETMGVRRTFRNSDNGAELAA